MSDQPQPYTPLRRLRDAIEDLQAAGVNFINFESAVGFACEQCPGLDENDRVKATAAALDQLVREGVLRKQNPIDPLDRMYLIV